MPRLYGQAYGELSTKHPKGNFILLSLHVVSPSCACRGRSVLFLFRLPQCPVPLEGGLQGKESLHPLISISIPSTSWPCGRPLTTVLHERPVSFGPARLRELASLQGWDNSPPIPAGKRKGSSLPACSPLSTRKLVPESGPLATKWKRAAGQAHVTWVQKVNSQCCHHSYFGNIHTGKLSTQDKWLHAWPKWSHMVPLKSYNIAQIPNRKLHFQVKPLFFFFF